MISRFDIDSHRSLRGLALAIFIGLVLSFSIPHPGQAQTAPESGVAVEPVGSAGLEPVPGVTPASSAATRTSDDTPADVRLVFGFTAGTVLVLSALAFLDRRPEP